MGPETTKFKNENCCTIDHWGFGKSTKSLKNNQTRDPNCMISELFKPNIAGKYLQKAISDLMNLVQTSLIIPEYMQYIGILRKILDKLTYIMIITMRSKPDYVEFVLLTLPLKFSQNRVSNSWDTPDMCNCHQNKCCLDKYCLDKCHRDS